MTSSCPPPGEDPNDWVDCFEGYVRGSDARCVDACGDQCCKGPGACSFTTACIKKDGSCNGSSACYETGNDSNHELLISGPSCVGDFACYYMFDRNPSTGVISVTNSCLCDEACGEIFGTGSCSGINPANYLGLPACGSDIVNVAGQTSSACAVSYILCPCVPRPFRQTRYIMTLENF